MAKRHIDRHQRMDGRRTDIISNLMPVHTKILQGFCWRTPLPSRFAVMFKKNRLTNFNNSIFASGVNKMLGLRGTNDDCKKNERHYEHYLIQMTRQIN